MVLYYGINDLCVGLKVIQNGEPYIIVHNEFVKPGKGQSFNRVRLKQIISGKILEKTIKSGDHFESANILELSLVFIYRDKDFCYFINRSNFEEIFVSGTIIGNQSKWMVEQENYTVTFWNENPVLVIPPNFIELKVIKTSMVMKNHSSSSGMKLAIVSTGAEIKVPLFIKASEIIKIDTRSGVYVSRVK